MFIEILSFKFELFFSWIDMNLREESKMKGETSMTLFRRRKSPHGLELSMTLVHLLISS